jgi:tRNA A-37 threonylcarbamoyl transferase component Bud32
VDNNYIVTTTPRNEDTEGFPLLPHESLYTAGFDFNQSFHLILSDHQVLFCDQVARVMPGKRMVVFGRWQDKQIVAKLFFDPKASKRHCESDVVGVKLLSKNKIPTPALFYEGHSKDNLIHVLIFSRIEKAVNLEDLFRSQQNSHHLTSILDSVIVEIATQHVLGLVQHDLHLRNFLLTDQIIYTLDGAQIDQFKGLLPKHQSLQNLALFLSQLGVNVDDLQMHLFEHYAKSRGWVLKSEDYFEIQKLIQQANTKRWHSYAKKIFRNSSHFARFNHWQSKKVVNRYFQDKELNAIVDNPEMAFQHRTAKLLKAGNSATVIMVKLDGRDYVIKRYNLKNTWHRLRRMFRETRAASSWRFAQKCYLFKVATAMPVAYIENRCFCLRGTSYYISRYVSRDHAGDFFFHHPHSEKMQMMIYRISTLLKSISKIDMSHGDLKITNILIDEHEHPILIDFDGAKEHASPARLKKIWHEEIKRFLENFKSNPAILKQFKMEFEKWT